MNHEDDIEFPYQQDKLHKSLINLKNKNLPEEEI